VIHRLGFIPRNQRGRILATIWLALCCALLVFAFVFRDMPSMPVVFTFGLIALTFPLGLPAGAVVGISMSWLYAHKGLPYDRFADLVPSWLVMVLAGYVQWFVLGPTLAQRLLKRLDSAAR